jgi:hypothetical protein
MNNTMKSSSIVLLSYHLYRSAYELEYSCLVILKLYEIAYSLCVMILTCSTSCLIIHMICMSRSRARVEVTVRRSFWFAHILACRSVGSESRGIWVASLYAGMVLECTGTFGYDGAPGWGVGGRWWQPCLSLVIPHVRVLCRSFKVSRACWQISARRSPCPS